MEKKKILIVEDELSLRQVLTDKLAKELGEKFEVISEKNGEDGLKTASKEIPDLILLDIIMPRMDGLTMLKKLRAKEKGKNIKVIILTNLSEAEKVAGATIDGVNEYLIKSDWKLEDLIKKVKQTLK